jgi:hypothetical protein
LVKISLKENTWERKERRLAGFPTLQLRHSPTRRSTKWYPITNLDFTYTIRNPRRNSRKMKKKEKKRKRKRNYWKRKKKSKLPKRNPIVTQEH